MPLVLAMGILLSSDVDAQIKFPSDLQRGSNKAKAPPPCIGDPRAPATLYGRFSSSLVGNYAPVIVQIFTGSTVASLYLDEFENALAGRVTTPSPAEIARPNAIEERITLERTSAAIISSAKIAIVDRGGGFNCRGFGSGKYVFLVTLRGIASTSAFKGYGAKIPVTNYYRAEAQVGDSKRPAAIAISNVRFIGRNPHEK